MNIRYPIYEGVYRILTSFLFFHFCYLCTAGFCFPYMSFINEKSDLSAAPLSFVLFLEPFIFLCFHFRLAVEVEMCHMTVSGFRLSAAFVQCGVYFPVGITDAEGYVCPSEHTPGQPQCGILPFFPAEPVKCRERDFPVGYFYRSFHIVSFSVCRYLVFPAVFCCQDTERQIEYPVVKT